MKEKFLSRDCMVKLKKPTKKIILENPEELVEKYPETLITKLYSTLGKYELESYVVDRLFQLSVDAVVQGKLSADISEFSGTEVHFFHRNEKETIKSAKSFLESFLKLPIFCNLREKEGTIRLEFGVE